MMHIQLCIQAKHLHVIASIIIYETCKLDFLTDYLA